MKTHTYTVQKGDNVKSQFVGTKVEIQNSTTVDEALKAGHFESEAAIVAAANAIRNIAVNRVVRKELAKDNGSTAEAIRLGNLVKVGAPRAASTPKSAKPSTIRKNTAAASGNRLFEKCATDADFLRRMVAQGIIDETEYSTWLANKDKKDEKKAPAATPATEAKTPATAGSAKAKR